MDDLQSRIVGQAKEPAGDRRHLRVDLDHVHSNVGVSPQKVLWNRVSGTADHHHIAKTGLEMPGKMVETAVFERRFVAVEEHRGLRKVRVGRKSLNGFIALWLDCPEDPDAAVFGVDVVKVVVLSQQVRARLIGYDREYEKQNDGNARPCDCERHKCN